MSCSIYKLILLLVINFGLINTLFAAITITVDGSTAEPVTVYNGQQSTLEAVVTNCPSANYYYETWYYRNGASGSCSGGSQTSISRVINSSCSTTPSINYTWTSNGQKTLCYGYNACSGFLSYFQCLIAYAFNSTDQVQAFRVFVDANPPSLTDFSISHDGVGINCSIETITITALDAGSNTVTNYTGTITLTSSSSNGDWSIITGNGTLNNAAADDGTATYNFVSSDSGVVVLGFKNTHAETLTITSADGSISSTSNNLVFYPYGFQILPNPIATQISGKNFNITLTAVGNPATDTGCTVITEYTGTKTLNFWSDYINPSTNPFNTAVTINGSAIGNSSATTTSINTSFTNGVSSAISVNYADAGQIQVHLRDQLILSSPTGTQVVIGGAAFTVRPFGFYITIPLNPAATNHLGTKFISAGESSGAAFAAVITAVAYQSADDLDNNNIPDGILDSNSSNNADLSNNSITQNFGNESPAASITLSRTHLHPQVADGGTIGILSGTSSLVATNGIATSNTQLRYSEVGIIEVNASSVNFFSNSIQGGSNSVGRFYPDHFSLIGTPTLTQRDDITGCTDTFTYLSENQSLDFQLQAQNSNNSITENYESETNYDYAFLAIDPDAPGGTGEINFSAINAPLGSATSLTSRLIQASVLGSFINGNAFITATVKVTKVSLPDGPYSDLRFAIKPQDKDTVSLLSSSFNLDPESVGVNTHQQIVAGNVLFGRGIINNAFGSEYVALSVPWQTQYYLSAQSGFVINSADNCSPLTTSIIDLSNAGSNPAQGASSIVIGSGSTIATVNNNPVTAGDSNLVFSPPSNSGYTDIDIKFGSLDYLQYDWDSNGSHDNNPATARATFGTFRGDDRIIYWKELFN